MYFKTKSTFLIFKEKLLIVCNCNIDIFWLVYSVKLENYSIQTSCKDIIDTSLQPFTVFKKKLLQT